jgi:hypothetical protein
MTCSLTLDDIKEKLKELQDTCQPEDYAVLCLAWCVEEIERLQEKAEVTNTLWATANQLGIFDGIAEVGSRPNPSHSELRICCPNCKTDQVVSTRVLLGEQHTCKTPICGLPLPSAHVRIVAKE